MVTSTATIINRLGLHARAAALLVKLSNSFESEIQMMHNGNVANTKNIMEVLMLAATQGSSIEVTINGTDEEKATEAILMLISNRFNESE